MKKNVDRKKVGKIINYGIVNSEIINKIFFFKIFFNFRLLFVDFYLFVLVDIYMFFFVSLYDSIICYWMNI